ncbi:hypothetical protein [Actinomadura chibensis]|uniref:Uncharacterized protein n=1 Tax=Actinomadura chibensis TaxID=392828 RepID=A0A5D0NVD3_9ACTN|nr:hypothetical protein [Actinomadura chibensis]TYB48159.1 hypothetical protein FXF69_02765 [Actinomadura chibensis]
MRDLLRYLGALLLFGIGALHLYEYFAEYYRVVPVIGILFAINFAGAVLLGLALIAPLESLPGLRSIPVAGRAPHALVAAGAIGFALGTIIGLLITEHGTLFGFHEYGYRTTIALALGLESGAAVVLAGFLALESRRPRRAAPESRPAGSVGRRPSG